MEVPYLKVLEIDGPIGIAYTKTLQICIDTHVMSMDVLLLVV